MALDNFLSIYLFTLKSIASSSEHIFGNQGVLRISGFIFPHSFDCFVNFVSICIVLAGDVDCNLGPASRCDKCQFLYCNKLLIGLKSNFTELSSLNHT